MWAEAQLCLSLSRRGLVVNLQAIGDPHLSDSSIPTTDTNALKGRR